MNDLLAQFVRGVRRQALKCWIVQWRVLPVVAHDVQVEPEKCRHCRVEVPKDYVLALDVVIVVTKVLLSAEEKTAELMP